MQNVLIIFSSQNGSTQKYAEKIKEVFIQKGYHVDSFNTQEKVEINPDDYDVIGVGGPTYYFRPSYEITDYLDTLGRLNGKKIFTFVTYGTEIGDGANFLIKKIIKTGAIHLGNLSCKTKNLFPGYTDRGYIFHPDKPSDEDIHSAAIFAEQLVSRIKSDKYEYTLPAKNDKTHPVLKFESFVTNRFFIKSIYSHFIKTERSHCNSCGACIKACPTQNISIQGKQMPVWGRECILCCNCKIHCPNQAIKTPLSWKIFSPFLWFNIFRAKNKKINFEHSK